MYDHVVTSQISWWTKRESSSFRLRRTTVLLRKHSQGEAFAKGALAKGGVAYYAESECRVDVVWTKVSGVDQGIAGPTLCNHTISYLCCIALRAEAALQP